ncbi:MAG: methyltransferase domain-containing protein [Lachnospiraceae bacterium]|nr:methyltransferase domain-containing protein [Lachnospiraceae bacterium]
MNAFKERVTNYWTKRADDFAELRIRELKSPLRSYWWAEMAKHLPMGRNLRILDLGTGTGFFTFLLTEKGNRVTGIDLTEQMIVDARKTADLLGMDTEFHVMDAEAPDFAEGSFDALVTRNLTWVLPNLADAYRNWFKLLAPGGVLINFDADYCHAGPQTELPENHAHNSIARELMEENDAITEEMKALQGIRPQWDVELLSAAGFERISIDTGTWRRIYRVKDEFYNPVPVFSIAAYKPFIA